MKLIKNTLRVVCAILVILSLLSSCKKSSPPPTSSSNTSNNAAPYPYGGATNPYYTCITYTAVSSDTNYIPHHKYNSWDYCSGSLNVADWTSYILADTTSNDTVYFTQSFDFNTVHAPQQHYHIKTMIDPSGNYYSVGSFVAHTATYTAKFICPSAINGDTLFKDQASGDYVKLINNDDNYMPDATTILPHSYHIEYGVNNSGKYNLYYKKGIGLLLVFGDPVAHATIH